MLAGQTGDIVTTGITSTFMGTREANPYSIAMIEHFGLFGYFAIKLIVVASATIFLLRLVNRFLTRYPKRPGNQTIADLTVLVCGGGGLFLLSLTCLNLWVGWHALQLMYALHMR